MGMGIAMLIIEGVITGYLMVKLFDLIIDMENEVRKLRIYHFMSHPVPSFILNYLISSMLNSFTQGGLAAGFANLGSSIIVAVFVPLYLKWRYDMPGLETRVAAIQLAKAQKTSRLKRLGQKVRRRKEAV